MLIGLSGAATELGGSIGLGAVDDPTALGFSSPKLDAVFAVQQKLIGEKLSSANAAIVVRDGRVVYLFHSEVDLGVIEEVVDTLYDDVVEDEDGEEQTDFSEYDPSMLDTDMAGELSDELRMMEVVEKIKGDTSPSEKFQSFLRQEVIEKDIPLIFINRKKNEIINVTETNELERIMNLYCQKNI